MILFRLELNECRFFRGYFAVNLRQQLVVLTADISLISFCCVSCMALLVFGYAICFCSISHKIFSRFCVSSFPSISCMGFSLTGRATLSSMSLELVFPGVSLSCRFNLLSQLTICLCRQSMRETTATDWNLTLRKNLTKSSPFMIAFSADSSLFLYRGRLDEFVKEFL